MDYSYSTKRRRIRARVREHLEYARNAMNNEPHQESCNDQAAFSPLRASTIGDQTSEDGMFESSSNNLTIYLLTRLLDKLEEISQQVTQNTIILQNLASQGMTPAAIPDGLVLPLNSAQEINQLEEGLMDKEFRAKVIQHLSCIGGDSVSSLVRRILRRVISSELAVKYNFSGAKGKNSFHTLQLRGVLIAAVRRTFSTASEADIDGVTRKFFSNARDRDGGRARRTSSGTRDN